MAKPGAQSTGHARRRWALPPLHALMVPQVIWAYFRGLLSGHPPPVPRLELFMELIEFRSFHNLPPMLCRYIQALPTATPIMPNPLGDTAPMAGPTGDPGP